jgi:hypothetical protein
MSALTVTLADFLDSALAGVDAKLTAREDCRDCKAAAGWCPECGRLDEQREALNDAFNAISRSAGDVEATRIFHVAIARVTGLPGMAAVLVVPEVVAR